MRSRWIGAALIALAAAPANAKPAPAKTKPAVTVKEQASPMKAPDLDIGQMMAVFDKIFPAQPDPPAARLALSRTAVQGLFPDGTYSRMMGGMMHGIVDRVMGLTPADFGAKPDKDKAPDTMTLHQKLAKDDPAFDERMKIMEQVIGEEFAKMAAIIEPKMREGLARSMARRFATDSGKAFGSQSMAMYVDPDVMRAVMSSFPEMMKAMPDAMQRVEAATAHLPKPKSEKPKPAS